MQDQDNDQVDMEFDDSPDLKKERVSLSEKIVESKEVKDSKFMEKVIRDLNTSLEDKLITAFN